MKIINEKLSITGPVGNIEAILYRPEQVASIARFAIMCHPHPLKEGTMHNKVVTTTARTLAGNGIPCMVFNFRGVGNSEGAYADAIGETDDCLAVYNYLCGKWPNASCWLGGFSFGSYVALCAHNTINPDKLVLIAPAVTNFDFASVEINVPMLLIQGEQDEVIEAEAVFKWYNSVKAPDKNIIKVAETGHFFHGKLIDLKGYIENSI